MKQGILTNSAGLRIESTCLSTLKAATLPEKQRVFRPTVYDYNINGCQTTKDSKSML